MEAYRNGQPINNNDFYRNVEVFVNIGTNPPGLFAIYDLPGYDNTYDRQIVTRKFQKFNNQMDLIEFLYRNADIQAANEYQYQHEKGKIISIHGNNIEIQTIKAGRFTIGENGEAEFEYIDIGDGSIRRIVLPREIVNSVIKQLVGDYEIIDTRKQALREKTLEEIPHSRKLQEIYDHPRQINPLSPECFDDMQNGTRRSEVFGNVEARRGTISKLKGTKGFVVDRCRKFRTIIVENIVGNLKIYMAALIAIIVLGNEAGHVLEAFSNDDDFINKVNPNRFKQTDRYILGNRNRFKRIVTDILTYNYSSVSDDDISFFFGFLDQVNKDNFNGDNTMSFYDYSSFVLNAEAKALLRKICQMYEDSFDAKKGYSLSKEKASNYVLFMSSLSIANENSIYDEKHQSKRVGYASTREMNIWDSLPPIIKAIEYQRVEEMAAQTGFSFNDNNRPRLYNPECNKSKDQTDVIVQKLEDERLANREFMLHLIFKGRQTTEGHSSSK